MSTDTVTWCAYCGRPITLLPMWLGGRAYHHQCTQPPGPQNTFQPTPITGEEVREIVRDELSKARVDWLRAAGVVVKAEGEDI